HPPTLSTSPTRASAVPAFRTVYHSITVVLFVFFFYSSPDHRDLHSFPTRRSSDLCAFIERFDRTQIEHFRADVFVLERLRNCERDRKSTRLNSSHSQISYAVFCLKKKIRAD